MCIACKCVFEWVQLHTFEHCMHMLNMHTYELKNLQACEGLLPICVLVYVCVSAVFVPPLKLCKHNDIVSVPFLREVNQGNYGLRKLPFL